MDTIGYYPGCALHGTSSEYDMSVRKVNEKFDLELKEIEDWICCGASSGHMTNRRLNAALNACNLKIAEDEGHSELLAPCPLCSKAMIQADEDLKNDPELNAEVGETIGGEYHHNVKTLNYLQLVEKYYMEQLAGKIEKKLEDVTAACYYGCLLTRPPDLLQFDDAERPRTMEKIVEMTGAKTIEWPFKTECCGAGFAIAEVPMIVEMTGRLLKNAKQLGADFVVAACPMCHANLDMRQDQIAGATGERIDLPVIYLSELLGLALGFSPKELGLKKHFVNAAPIVNKFKKVEEEAAVSS